MCACFGQLRLAILAILRLHPCGAIVLAPVCSGFSFMCSSQAQRYFFNPEGNLDLSWVRAGNIMANRVTLLAWLATALGHSWFRHQRSSATYHGGDFSQNISHMPLGYNFDIFISCKELFSFRCEESFSGVRSSFFPSEKQKGFQQKCPSCLCVCVGFEATFL